MSYTSTSILSKKISLSQVQDMILLLGYTKLAINSKVPDLAASYFWAEEKDYQSYVGVELDVYRDRAGHITVATRSRVGRSYWDLIQQNKTLKMFRDLMGGNFTTDAGHNRYWRPDEPPPSPLSSGCFLARWRFHNNIGRAQMYLSNREFKGTMAKDEPSGLYYMDELNPRLLSNNFLLPYLIAVWEEVLPRNVCCLP